jgi:hypothetical protein
MEAVKKNVKRMEFGLKALEQMKIRLYEFPSFCEELFDPSVLLVDRHPDVL